MAAGAGAGRAGCVEAVNSPLPVHAVPAQADDTISAADSPIPGETSRTGLYCWKSVQSGPRAAEFAACQHRDQPAAEYLYRGRDGHADIGVLQKILREQQHQGNPPLRAAGGGGAADMVLVAGIAVRPAAGDMVLSDHAAVPQSPIRVDIRVDIRVNVRVNVRVNIRINIRVSPPSDIRVNVAVYIGARSRYAARMDIRSAAGGVEARDQDAAALSNRYSGVSRYCHRN